MMARNSDALSVDHNTLKYQPDNKFNNDLSKSGDNVGNSLELLNRTMPDNNSLMGGSFRGNQVDIGRGDLLAFVQPSMESQSSSARLDRKSVV